MDGTAVGGILGGAAGCAVVINTYLDNRQKAKTEREWRKEQQDRLDAERRAKEKESEWDRLRELVEQLDHQLGTCYQQIQAKDAIIEAYRKELGLPLAGLQLPAGEASSTSREIPPSGSLS